ncbi:hypothetical protein E2C01_020753 [Portunus trituberculatus]|uniref:Uncharacterized protein n=1 Tax=Portunus trituberculatus TaxID=210409 RepID=A0A5B7E110_PORTR|nr:hypothetical protein [Portunus trituberculatus]
MFTALPRLSHITSTMNCALVVKYTKPEAFPKVTTCECCTVLKLAVRRCWGWERDGAGRGGREGRKPRRVPMSRASIQTPPVASAAVHLNPHLRPARPAVGWLGLGARPRSIHANGLTWEAPKFYFRSGLDCSSHQDNRPYPPPMTRPMHMVMTSLRKLRQRDLSTIT